ncbi:hypothetical protein QA641_06080 [Bradyrhizobium sp. CB1650]|uniref:hypothetical protein n=1 Tax=Bradyrhizobium sp. CB1650 TaxID=3039153 RepID=UPI002434D392|nr:hypothetical protein [Bradyrhizobium sp. CB1650]WGD53483.1 hypothetical protein QA641_06080 [Bradyrhizobium sp. CB1650]
MIAAAQPSMVRWAFGRKSDAAKAFSAASKRAHHGYRPEAGMIEKQVIPAHLTATKHLFRGVHDWHMHPSGRRVLLSATDWGYRWRIINGTDSHRK